jgi:hypothetical protein
MNAHQPRPSATTFAGLAWLALAFCLTAVRASDREDIQTAGHLERIDYYGMALAAQREAMAVSSLEADQALADYRGALQGQAAETAARLKVELDALVALETSYSDKLQATMAALAGEHDGLAAKWQAQQVAGEAGKHILSSATLWTQSGELSESIALQKREKADFDGAGAAFEKAYAAYNTACSRWNQARRLSATVGMDDTVRETSNKGLQALQSASLAYADAIEAHAQKAREETMDIHRGTAGDEWRLAAVAQQNRERMQLLIRTLTQKR